MDARSDPSSSSSAGRSTSPLPPIPLQNPKYRHISRSAAKRESVQLLGSIKDLQLHFSRAGLVEHRPGSGVGVKGLGGITEGDEENQPPPPASSRRSGDRRPWKEVELPRIDPLSARREARGLIGTVRGLWGLGLPSSPSYSTLPVSPTRPFDLETRTILVSTAQAIRRIRFLALSISHAPGRRVSGSALLVPKPRSRLGFSTPSRPAGGLPRAVSYSTGERKSSLGPIEEIQPDGLGELRKAALEVLAGLRGLEERLRSATLVEADVRARSPDESSASSAVESESNRAASTTFTEPDNYDSEEEDYNLNALAQSSGENEHLMTWEERILVEGREYAEIGEGEKVEGVRDGVRKWVGVVEGLFGVREGAGLKEVEEWAREEGWEGKSTERLHAFLTANLPIHLQIALPQPVQSDFDTELMSCLSDGFILAQAFNAVLAASPKSWGFIPEDEIHDTMRVGSEGTHTPDAERAKQEREWTFRRVGNLTCWAAALRPRYNLPVHMPNQSASLLNVPGLPPRTSSLSPTNSPSPGSSPSLSPQLGVIPRRRKDNAPRIDFDPLVVAKRGDGWEEMLTKVLVVWVEEAAKEAREMAEAEGFGS